MEKNSRFGKITGALSREEMRNVKGGCGWSGNSTYGQQCGISYAQASALQQQFGGYWCCASCGSSSYCG